MIKRLNDKIMALYDTSNADYDKIIIFNDKFYIYFIKYDISCICLYLFFYFNDMQMYYIVSIIYFMTKKQHLMTKLIQNDTKYDSAKKVA